MAQNQQENIPQNTESLPHLPASIQSIVNGKPFKMNDVGMSGARIYVFDDFVLKIVDISGKDGGLLQEKNDATVQVMRWLEGKLPVPKVLAYESESSFLYMLMSRVPGKMSCETYYLERPRELVHLLARALKLLWSVDIAGCPYDRNIDKELAEAKFQVENDLVDVDDAEPTTFRKDGFENPAELLHWLETHKPVYEPVLSHGDFCLPNIFIKDGEISGFIDLDACGVGDKWRDIALCYRSLKHNFDGTYGGKVYPDFNPDMLFEELGMEPNEEKLKFYILLDELF